MNGGGYPKIPIGMMCAEMAGHQVVSVKALAPLVLAVAVLKSPGNQWAVYVDSIPDDKQRQHIVDVVEADHVQERAVAKAIFPKLASNRLLRLRRIPVDTEDKE